MRGEPPPKGEAAAVFRGPPPGEDVPAAPCCGCGCGWVAGEADEGGARDLRPSAHWKKPQILHEKNHLRDTIA